MIDIVPRLRERSEHEAADEIEWLRGERNRLAADLAKAHLDIVAWIEKAQETYRE